MTLPSEKSRVFGTAGLTHFAHFSPAPPKRQRYLPSSCITHHSAKYTAGTLNIESKLSFVLFMLSSAAVQLIIAIIVQIDINSVSVRPSHTTPLGTHHTYHPHLLFKKFFRPPGMSTRNPSRMWIRSKVKTMPNQRNAPNTAVCNVQQAPRNPHLNNAYTSHR